MVLVPLVVSGLEGAAYWADGLEGLRLNPARGILWNVEEWTRAPA
jgi:hypothetical protein